MNDEDEIGEHLSLEPELDPLDEMDPLTEEVLLDAYEDLFDAYDDLFDAYEDLDA